MRWMIAGQNQCSQFNWIPYFILSIYNSRKLCICLWLLRWKHDDFRVNHMKFFMTTFPRRPLDWIVRIYLWCRWWRSICCVKKSPSNLSISYFRTFPEKLQSTHSIVVSFYDFLIFHAFGQIRRMELWDKHARRRPEFQRKNQEIIFIISVWKLHRSMLILPGSKSALLVNENLYHPYEGCWDFLTFTRPD